MIQEEQHGRQFAFWADVVTVISGAFTILGVSGVLSWSLFGHGPTAFTRLVLTISAFSIKSFFCLVLLGVAFALIGAGQVVLALAFKGEAVYWEKDHPLPHVGAWLILLMPTLPFCVAFCLCIYQSSWHPIVQLWIGLSRGLFWYSTA